MPCIMVYIVFYGGYIRYYRKSLLRSLHSLRLLHKHGIEWHTIMCYNDSVENWAQGGTVLFLCACIGDAGAGGRVGSYHERGTTL